MIRHDSHIRSDWLNAGLTRGQATRLAQEVTAHYVTLGEGGDVRAKSHSGRRDDWCDAVTVTSPGGWGENHAHPSTIKIRGCDAFRRDALRVARDLLPNYDGSTKENA